MERPTPEQLTMLLASAADGDAAAHEELLPLVYEELQQLARSQMRREAINHTLQPTALVHEAYVRLLGNGEAGFANRAHFFGAAAQAMRRVLIDRARRNRAEKHGGDRARVTMAGVDPSVESSDVDLLALDDALTRLEANDPRMAQIVTLRFFSGLGVEETAAALDISPRTVKRDWAVARAWLYRELGGDASGEDPDSSGAPSG